MVSIVNLTANVTLPNIAAYDAVGSFDLNSGAIGLRLYLVGKTRFKDVTLMLSDTAGTSRGLVLNGSPQTFDDTYNVETCGVALALTNAQTSYRSAPNHLAGIKAVLLRGVTDGWLDASLAGS